MTDELAARLALLELTAVGPARASWLMGEGSALEAVVALRAERLPTTRAPAPPGVTTRLVQRWSSELRSIEPERLLGRVTAAGGQLLGPDDASWPFGGEDEAPLVIFCRGDRALLEPVPRVAIVGTRRCSAIGREVAFDFGRRLALAGITVVSGLASGIDGAAHAGTLAARSELDPGGSGAALAVVGTGIDVVYPRSNRKLWDRVGEDGLIVSEAPLGARPERWRFPARNRLIAALADVVVVVESHVTGGSLLTVDEALARNRRVMAVPGSVTSPASAGSNQLLLDGCEPACSADDVLAALGQERPNFGEEATGGASDGSGSLGHHHPDPLAQLVLDNVAAGAVHIDQLVASCRATIPQILATVTQLEDPWPGPARWLHGDAANALSVMIGVGFVVVTGARAPYVTKEYHEYLSMVSHGGQEPLCALISLPLTS